MIGNGATYGAIPYWVRYDKKISPYAKVLFAEISAVAVKGRTRRTNDYFAKVLGMHSRTIYKSMGELAERGYIERAGNIKSRVITIPERYTATVTHVKFISDKELPNEDEIRLAAKLLTLWNNKLNCKLKLTEKIRKAVKARLDSFSKEDLETAIKNRLGYVMNSSWHNEPQNRKHKINILIPLRNDDELQGCLNMTSEEIFKADVVAPEELDASDFF